MRTVCIRPDAPARLRSAVTRVCECIILESAYAVLWETAETRRRVHRAHQVRDSCDANLVVSGREALRNGTVVFNGGGAPEACGSCGRATDHRPAATVTASTGYRLSGDCPCAVFLADAMTCTFLYLAENGAALRNPAAAVRRHIRARQHDHVRAIRLARGAQVRTDRLVEGAIGRRLATREQRDLLRDLADEAGSEAPLESDAHLVLRLASLRARRSGGEADRLVEDIRRDREVVRAACLANRLVNVGSRAEPEHVSWWEAYIERPLGRRRRASDLSLESEGGSGDDGTPWLLTGPLGAADGERSSMEESGEALLELLRWLDGHGEFEAAQLLGHAIGLLSRRNGIGVGTVDDFLADRERREHALAAITDLRWSWRSSRNASAPADEQAMWNARTLVLATS